MRGHYQGMWNVVRFNWPKYVLGSGAALAAIALTLNTTGGISTFFLVFAVAGTAALLLPLAVSHLIYDRSMLYDLPWLSHIDPQWTGTVLNISAGFDETTALVRQRLRSCTLHAMDFYDPARHTEPSIERARKARTPYPGTTTITTARLPCQDRSVDLILAFLSLHEIREAKERALFLTEIHRTLKPEGLLIVTEHIRDAPNFAAFNFGFFHFQSRATWMNTFLQAGFMITKTEGTTPFITTFTLQRQ